MIDIEVFGRKKASACATHKAVSFNNIGNELGQITLHLLPKLLFQGR
jgi:hypothetical protein